jgi:hypothetical protein
MFVVVLLSVEESAESVKLKREVPQSPWLGIYFKNTYPKCFE